MGNNIVSKSRGVARTIMLDPDSSDARFESGRDYMDEKLKQLHLNAGRLSGEQKTCGTKMRHPTEEIAKKVANKMNARPLRKYDVEPYPCPFCGMWHLGRTMPIDVLKSFAAEKE